MFHRKLPQIYCTIDQTEKRTVHRAIIKTKHTIAMLVISIVLLNSEGDAGRPIDAPPSYQEAVAAPRPLPQGDKVSDFSSFFIGRQTKITTIVKGFSNQVPDIRCACA